MHGATTKIINAQQARLNNIYKNTKLKLLKVNAAIWFNKICRKKQMKPNYISLKINGRRQRDLRTTTHAIKFRIKQEIKFLYKKKQNLNKQHILCSVTFFLPKIMLFMRIWKQYCRARQATDDNMDHERCKLDT
jgi:hypothetical protein